MIKNRRTEEFYLIFNLSNSISINSFTGFDGGLPGGLESNDLRKC